MRMMVGRKRCLNTDDGEEMRELGRKEEKGKGSLEKRVQEEGGD